MQLLGFRCPPHVGGKHFFFVHESSAWQWAETGRRLWRLLQLAYGHRCLRLWSTIREEGHGTSTVSVPKVGGRMHELWINSHANRGS
eukprot:scaffold10351_cov62-Phaeocystis_antarctica.AAC.8